MLEEQELCVPGFALSFRLVHAVLQQPAGHRLSLYKTVELLHQRTTAQARRIPRGQLRAGADFWHPGAHELPLLDAAELTRVQACLLGYAARLQLSPRYHAWPYQSQAPPPR